RGPSRCGRRSATRWWGAPRMAEARQRPDDSAEGARARASAAESPGAEQEPAEHEPDYRFTLANERTFLAWIRTSLGLIAGGVVVHQLFEPLATAPRRIIAIGCVVLAIAVAAGAYFHWRSVQRAMRRDAP